MNSFFSSVNVWRKALIEPNCLTFIMCNIKTLVIDTNVVWHARLVDKLNCHRYKFGTRSKDTLAGNFSKSIWSGHFQPLEFVFCRVSFLFGPYWCRNRASHSAPSTTRALFLKFQAGRLFSSEAIMTLLTRQTIIFKSRSMASELSASKHQQRRRQNSLPETTRPASTAAVEMQKNEFISRLSAATTSDEESICSRGRHGLMSCFVTSNFFHKTKRREEKKTGLLRK